MIWALATILNCPFLALVLFVPLTSLFSFGPLHKPHSPNSLPMTLYPHISLKGMLLPQACLLLVVVFFFFSYDWLLHVIQVWIQTCPSERGFHGHQSKGVPPYFILTFSTTFLDRIFQSIYHYLELSYLIVCLFMNSSAMRVTYILLKIIKLCEITYY